MGAKFPARLRSRWSCVYSVETLVAGMLAAMLAGLVADWVGDAGATRAQAHRNGEWTSKAEANIETLGKEVSSLKGTQAKQGELLAEVRARQAVLGVSQAEIKAPQTEIKAPQAEQGKTLSDGGGGLLASRPCCWNGTEASFWPRLCCGGRFGLVRAGSGLPVRSWETQSRQTRVPGDQSGHRKPRAKADCTRKSFLVRTARAELLY